MDDDAFTATRTSLHILCEHMLSPARHQAVGRIGLAVVAGGFATPTYGEDDMSVAVIDGELVLRGSTGERRTALTTLRAAGQFVGVTPGAPTGVYSPTTACDLDAPLRLDPIEYHRIASWYALVAEALERFSDAIPEDDPSGITLWPEHFDVAIRAGEVNYGGLAGDATIPAPYIYVGPPTAALPTSADPLWNQPFGAGRTEADITTVDDAVEFFRLGRVASASLPSSP